MSQPARLIATLFLATLLGGASMLSAVAEDRCTGTLCDFYYGAGGGDAKTQPQAGKAAATPVTVPSGGILGFFGSPAPASTGTPASAPVPRVAVQGGGLVGKLNGAAEERCTGTLCDIYYGGPPPERPEPAAASLAPNRGASAREPASANTLAPAEPPDYAPIPARQQREVERDAKPRCVAPAADPWRCYR